MFQKPGNDQLKSISKGLFGKSLLGLLLFAILNLILPASVLAASPLAVVKSAVNAQAYGDQHLGDFDIDWPAFKQTLESANVRYEVLTDDMLSSPNTKLSNFKVIVFPLLTDLNQDGVFALTQYVRNGGKLLLTDSGGTPSQNAAALLELAGVKVVKHGTLSENRSLDWERSPLPVQETFAIGTQIADVTVTGDAQACAQWKDATNNSIGPAIVKKPSSIYLTWAPGLQGEITTNASLISLSLEELSQGITQQAAVQISYAEYQSISQDLEYLTKRTDEIIATAKQADLAVPHKIIQQHYEAATSHVRSFHEAYKARRFYQADEDLQKARQEFALSFAKAMPVRRIEGRSVWLDRGTIVATKGPSGMSKLFDRLKNAGINIVYFETDNAGFAMFPSKIYQQNPETKGWDPLGCAVTEAHKRGMELHSWNWIFAVGNIRHNPIIGKDPDYPGPVLSAHDLSWALASSTGSLLPYNQPEFWIDPANPEGRQHIKDFLLEIATKYDIDGLQYDYIRYPFNNIGSEMGYDWVGRMRFEQETGLSLDKLDTKTREVWQAWKIMQVNTFVEDTANALRTARPSIKLSAAVYATPRRLRLMQIQQDWEIWVTNGWLDTVNPMTYRSSPTEFGLLAQSCREASQDKALVFPGLKIMSLDTAGFVEQLDRSREIGTLGTTVFAVAQLDDKKVELLKEGPFRKSSIMTPQSHPVQASRYLFDDFASLVNRYLQDPTKRILSDQSSTNDILSQIEGVQSSLHQLNEGAQASELDNVYEKITTLHAATKEWLRLEAFIQRGYRAMYITNYLSQVEAILSYASHHAKTTEKMQAAAKAKQSGSNDNPGPLGKQQVTSPLSAAF